MMLFSAESHTGSLEACNRLDGGGEGAILDVCGLVRRHTLVTCLVLLVVLVLATLLLLLLALAPPSPRAPRGAQHRQLLAQLAVSRPLPLRSVLLRLPCSLRQPHARRRRLDSAHRLRLLVRESERRGRRLRCLRRSRLRRLSLRLELRLQRRERRDCPLALT
jgi:hypothetical protein